MDRDRLRQQDADFEGVTKQPLLVSCLSNLCWLAVLSCLPRSFTPAGGGNRREKGERQTGGGAGRGIRDGQAGVGA